jgi:hypothetical protein
MIISINLIRFFWNGKRANLSFLFEPSPNYPDAKMNVGELSLHSSMNHLFHPCIAVTNDHRVILKTLDFPAIHRSFLNKNAAFHGRRMNKNWIVVILTELSRLFNTLSIEELFINEKHVYPFYRGLIGRDSIFHPSMVSDDISLFFLPSHVSSRIAANSCKH